MSILAAIPVDLETDAHELVTACEAAAGDMVLLMAEVDPEAFLARACRHAGVLIGICATKDCRTRLGAHDAEGMPGGISHGLCPGCGVKALAETGRYFAQRGRN